MHLIEMHLCMDVEQGYRRLFMSIFILRIRLPNLREHGPAPPDVGSGIVAQPSIPSLASQSANGRLIHLPLSIFFNREGQRLLFVAAQYSPIENGPASSASRLTLHRLWPAERLVEAMTFPPLPYTPHEPNHTIGKAGTTDIAAVRLARSFGFPRAISQVLILARQRRP